MRRAVDWALRDRATGAITIAQRPNAPLLVFGLCAAVDWAFAPAGSPGTALRLIGAAALIVWAVDEVARGVNPWRRCLGGAVLALMVWRLV